MCVNNIQYMCECGNVATTPITVGWGIYPDGTSHPAIEWWCDDCMEEEEEDAQEVIEDEQEVEEDPAEDI